MLIWKSTGKLPEAPAPMLEAVEESVTGVPAVALAGDVGDAVRSGKALTVTIAWAVPEPALLVHVSV